MKRFLSLAIGAFLCWENICSADDNALPSGQEDRAYWSELAYKIAKPVLENMSKGELAKNMTVELSPSKDERSPKFTYMEAFARTMAGIAPWLSLPDDGTNEGAMRKELRTLAIQCYINAVDPQSPDCLDWRIYKGSQTLVEAAYIAESFIRAPKLWEALPQATKQRYIDTFHNMRQIDHPNSNWVLFAAMPETFLMSIGEQYEASRIFPNLDKIESWFIGDGFYSDGPQFAMDYYNSYVIHPMYVDIIDVLTKHGHKTPAELDTALQRMQRYGVILERFISPEGTFPAVGRSITYRMGAFQALALLAWKYDISNEHSNGQVRSALSAVMRRMFANPDNFGDKGFLQLGFVGHQPDISDYYTNNGSLYITTLVFLPLGLPADHPFWTTDPEDWTSRKAWSGQPFPRDSHY